MPPVSIPQAFTLALEHYQVGRLAEAEALCRQILKVAPSHPEAWHQLGLIALRAGRAELAVDWMRQALVLTPDNFAAHSNLGEAYRRMDRLDEAIAS